VGHDVSSLIFLELYCQEFCTLDSMIMNKNDYLFSKK
jgi:hypothetical protein